MINEISIIGISVLLFLPFLLKSSLKLNDYYGYIMGIRFLIISIIAQQIINYVVPDSSIYKKNLNLGIEEILKLSMKEKALAWAFDLFNSIITFLILNYCISQISKPTQNYNSIFLFILGIGIQYILPFAIYLVLPLLSKNQKFLEILEKHKLTDKYLSGEFVYNSLKNTISKIANDIGICLIILITHKKLLSRKFCYLNYFGPKLIKLLILCCGLVIIDKYFYIIIILPLIFGLFYYFKFIANGQLTNKYKDDYDYE